MSRRNTPSGSPRREHGTPSRWDQYWELLVAKRIPQQAQRWYVTHVQDFLDAVQPNSLKGLSQEEITGYLRQTSSQGKWQALFDSHRANLCRHESSLVRNGKGDKDPVLPLPKR